MFKKAKILLILFIIAVLAVLYLLKTAEPVALVKKQSDKLVEKAEKIDLERLEAEYKEDVKELLSDYSLLAEAADFTSAQAESVKNQLLELKVPTVFKDLHINFVLAITKMENFLLNGDSEEKFFSQEMIDEMKEGYDWLK